MIYFTGDKHRDYKLVERFCKEYHTQVENDAIVVLGDNGVNFFGRCKDRQIKKALSQLPITFVFIRGNHDQRPSPKYYRDVHVCNPVEGDFWAEDDYPNLLFCHEYGEYRFGDFMTFVAGGAYSVDKLYRLSMQEIGFKKFRWFPDEQLTPNEMRDALSIAKRRKAYDLVLTHTCPLKYKPFFNDSFPDVDETMERWMDELEESIDYKLWLCGHYHMDNKMKDKVMFMFNDIVSEDYLKELIKNGD